MLKQLCDMIGVSGYEDEILDYIQSILIKNGNGEIYRDNIGNLICHIKGADNTKKILVMAHADEVGFQITRQIDDACFEFKVLGNVKMWNLHQQRIIFANGLRGVVFAKDETNIDAKNYENMYVKVFDGSDKIKVGDIFTFDNTFIESGDCYFSKALDNRISCFGIMKSLVNKKNFKNDVYIVFTVQEELGMRGGKVAVSSIKPEIVISLDVSNVGKYNNLQIGKGAGIKISDSAGVADQRLVQWMEKIAEENGICYQLEVSDCGTNEMVLVNDTDLGSRNIGVSLPCQYMHSANTMVNKEDAMSFFTLLDIIFKYI